MSALLLTFLPLLINVMKDICYSLEIAFIPHGRRLWAAGADVAAIIMAGYTMKIIAQAAIGGGTGFTPTRVGTMARTPGAMAWWAVHPRALGDNLLHFRRAAVARGSPSLGNYLKMVRTGYQSLPGASTRVLR